MISTKHWNNKAYAFEYLLRYFVWGIIATGILLRVVVYLQCNSMFEDEANVARNIFERSYFALIKPLDYYQYAPPVFLWIVKASTSLFGFSEYAYRLFPLICGLLSIWAMFRVLQFFTRLSGIWYALLLLALGPIYVHYSTATKQYIPDMLVGILLVWLALKTEHNQRSGTCLFLIWAIAGSIAIWISMPSVFILTGVGAYYFYAIVKNKDYSKLTFLFAVGLLWVIQFLAYYVLVLMPQANSSYLQNFHKEYFFYFPTDLQVFYRDVDLLSVFISTVGGHQVLSLLIHITCMAIAIGYMTCNQTSRLLLIIIPLLTVLLAAALHQYSLIPRLTLFAMPLMLILIAYGMEKLLSNRLIIVRLAVIVFAIINVVNFNAVKNFVCPMQQEEMKLSLNFLLRQKINGNELYVEQLGVPAYVYYTDIHPQRGRWASLSGATLLNWGINFDSLSRTFPARAAMLYGWDDPDKIFDQQKAIRSNVAMIDSNIVKGSRAYIYGRR